MPKERPSFLQTQSFTCSRQLGTIRGEKSNSGTAKRAAGIVAFVPAEKSAADAGGTLKVVSVTNIAAGPERQPQDGTDDNNDNGNDSEAVVVSTIFNAAKTKARREANLALFRAKKAAMAEAKLDSSRQSLIGNSDTNEFGVVEVEQQTPVEPVVIPAVDSVRELAARLAGGLHFLGK